MAARLALGLALLALSLLSTVQGFYLPGVAPQDFKKVSPRS